jgi:hypothetical protein
MELPRAEMELIDVEPPDRTEIDVDQTAGLAHDGNGDAADVEWPAATWPRPEPPPDTLPGTSPMRLTTAADLAGLASSRRTTGPDAEITAGTLVAHPRYGLGKVTTLGGSGRNRTATVQFFTPANQRTFQIERSPLTPLRPSP